MSEPNTAVQAGWRHNPDGCGDADCLRCKKISTVIMLNRKTTKNGCSVEEALSASLVANKLIKQYRLSKGDVRDPEYDVPIVQIREQAQKEYHKQYSAAQARTQSWNRRARPSGRRKMSGYDRRFADEEMSDD